MTGEEKEAELSTESEEISTDSTLEDDGEDDPY